MKDCEETYHHHSHDGDHDKLLHSHVKKPVLFKRQKAKKLSEYGSLNSCQESNTISQSKSTGSSLMLSKNFFAFEESDDEDNANTHQSI